MDPISQTVRQYQNSAWEAHNSAFTTTGDPGVLRAAGNQLYADAIHVQVRALFAKSDAQNALLDSAIAGGAR